MISLLEPFGNTETFGWPISCHMPYWVEDGQTLLSSSAVFSFLGISSVHNYKCYSFHLEYHGLKNAFGGGSENDGSLISLEAFLHFLFGGLFPFCHCEKGTPSSKIPEVRKFFMEKLTKGQSIEVTSPAETHELPTNPVNISRDHGELKGQYEIKISKYYSVEAQDSFHQGGTLSEQCTDIQNSDGNTGAVASVGNNIRVITDINLNDASDERMDDDYRSSEGHRVAFIHCDSQIRQSSGQLSNSSNFVSDAAVQPETQLEENSLLDCASVRLQEQHVDVGFGSVAHNVEPMEYTHKQVIKHKPCAMGEDSLSQTVALSGGDPRGFGDGDDDDDDNGDQSDKFAAVVVKQENAEGEVEGQQCMSSRCVLVTDSNLESSEGLELNVGHSDEDSAVDCGPIEIVHLPQEIATGASYFDPSTSSITTGSVDNHITSLQQCEGIGSRSVGLSTESSHALGHSSSVDQTPDGISRHLQYSQRVERENFNRKTATNSDQNQVFNMGLHTDASQWKMPGFAASLPLRHKLGKSGTASSTCTSTNYSQLHQEPSPGSATIILRNKRMRTDVENATVTTNIPRHTSAPSTTELNQVPSWISLGSTTARALNVMSGARRQESNTGNQSISSVTRSPVHYTQGTSLLNSNVGQGSLSSATGMPSIKDQAAQERTDSSTSRKTGRRRQCTRCKGKVEAVGNHVCRTLRCTMCSVTCKTPGNLRRHMSVHTGVRPFKCTVQNCGKSFARKDYYVKHLEVHVRKGMPI